MARPNASETVQRWTSGVQQAGPRYSSGIQNSKDWAQAAVAAGPARNAGLQRAISAGTIDRGIQNLGTAGWRSKTMAKGPQNWMNGVQQAQAAYSAGVQKLYGYLDAADSAVANMPRGGRQENIARMTTYVNAVADAAAAAKGY